MLKSRLPSLILRMPSFPKKNVVIGHDRHSHQIMTADKRQGFLSYSGAQAYATRFGVKDYSADRCNLLIHLPDREMST